MFFVEFNQGKQRIIFAQQVKTREQIMPDNS
jgi:hypothetical protein